MDSELEIYQAQVLDQCRYEVLQQHPVYNRFRFHHFVSKSKGRKKRRRAWKEIELINDAYKGLHKWITSSKYPYDDAATEVYPKLVDGLAATQRLVKEIPIYAKR